MSAHHEYQSAAGGAARRALRQGRDDARRATYFARRAEFQRRRQAELDALPDVATMARELALRADVADRARRRDEAIALASKCASWRQVARWTPMEVLCWSRFARQLGVKTVAPTLRWIVGILRRAHQRGYAGVWLSKAELARKGGRHWCTIERTLARAEELELLVRVPQFRNGRQVACAIRLGPVARKICLPSIAGRHRKGVPAKSGYEKTSCQGFIPSRKSSPSSAASASSSPPGTAALDLEPAGREPETSRRLKESQPAAPPAADDRSGPLSRPSHGGARGAPAGPPRRDGTGRVDRADEKRRLRRAEGAAGIFGGFVTRYQLAQERAGAAGPPADPALRKLPPGAPERAQRDVTRDRDRRPPPAPRDNRPATLDERAAWAEMMARRVDNPEEKP